MANSVIETLNNLQTNTKESLIDAINEVNQGFTNVKSNIEGLDTHLAQITRHSLDIYYEVIEGDTFKDKIVNLTALALSENVHYRLILPKNTTVEIADDEIEIDAYYVTLKGENTVLKYIGSTPQTSYLINIINTVIDDNDRVFEGFVALNDVSGKKIGIVFGGATTSGMSNIVLQSVHIKRFYPCCEYRSNAYLIRHMNCKFVGGVNMPSGYTNYGENISFRDCIFYNTTAYGVDAYCVKNANSNGDFRFSQCSFDYSTKIVICTAGGIIMDNCHLEFRLGGQNNNIYNYEAFFAHGSSARIVISNSRILGTKSFATTGIPDATNRPYIFVVNGGDWNTDNRASIELINCSLWGLETTSGELCGGNASGLFTINGTHSVQLSRLPLVTKKSNNKRSRFEVVSNKCTYEKITDTVNGISRTDVLKFTVTEFGASVQLKFPTDRPITYRLWFKQDGALTDAYVTARFINDVSVNYDTSNTNSNDWVSFASSRFNKPSESENALLIAINRGQFTAGRTFYCFIEEIYEW